MVIAACWPLVGFLASVGGLVFLCGGLTSAAASPPFLPGMGSNISLWHAIRFRPPFEAAGCFTFFGRLTYNSILFCF